MGRDLGVHERQGSGAVRGQFGAGVEAEPAEPQQARAEQHQREVVGPVLLLGPAPALAEDEREREARGAGVDVDDGAAGEVLDPQAAEPAATPHPVGDGEVHQRGPGDGEYRPGAELRSVRDRAADQRDGDDGERQLEGGEYEVGDARHPRRVVH